MRMPNWIECKKIYSKDNRLYADIRIRYLPFNLIWRHIYQNFKISFIQYPFVVFLVIRLWFKIKFINKYEFKRV